MNKMSTLIGLGAAFFVVFATMILEGSNPVSFLNLSAFVLIFGGCLAVSVISFSMKEAFSIPQYITEALFAKTINFKELIVTFISLAEKARREGLLILEEELDSIQDKIMKLGLTLIIDAVDPEIISKVLSDYNDTQKSTEKIPSDFFATLGGFSPTLGIIGTVMGLVHVLENLGTGGTEAVGSGIAVAFIATFYGIGFANLVFLPLSNRLNYVNKEKQIQRQIVTTGLFSIQSGDNPHLLKERLLVLIPDETLRAQIREELKG